ncbi:MAG TPA: hypothetical protein ENK75_02740 [Saprospiraceae bacterium]|nr:hypothetical protein [Saprospiraceae bacterium]
MIKNHILKIIICIFLTTNVSGQNNFEGYILCIDNGGDLTDAEHVNDYFFIPPFDADTLSTSLNDEFIRENIYKIGGLEFYQGNNFEGCIGESNKIVDAYSQIFFFYFDNDRKSKRFRLKIKRQKYYICRVKLEGCIQNDPTYTDVKIKKMFVNKISDINSLKEKELNGFKKLMCNYNSSKPR